MTDYVLPHTLGEEGERLSIMSRMLDPQLFFRLGELGIADGWRCLEVGAGNGSVSVWLAGRVAPHGSVVVSDIDTRFLEPLHEPGLEVRRIDVVSDPLGDDRDLVVARALLHHLPQRFEVLDRLADAVAPGGRIAIEEPDFHPVLATDSPTLRAFWEGYLAWAADQGIDYFVGRRVAPALVSHGFEDVRANGETILYPGNSVVARYWELTLRELEGPIRESGLVTDTVWDEAMTLLHNPRFWSWQNCYVTTTARRPG